MLAVQLNQIYTPDVHEIKKQKQSQSNLIRKSEYTLGNEGKLPDTGVVPHCMSQSQRVATAHLRVGLMASREIEEAERIAHPLRLRRQAGAADNTHYSIVKDNPIWLL